MPAASAVTALPEDLKLTITGGGWGHGHGMSQYGARAQAEAGRTWRQILHSYYTGVDIVDRGSESLRVLVGTGSSIAVGGPEAYSAKWAGGTLIANSSSTYPYMRVRATSAGVSVDRAGAPGGPWTQFATGTKNVYFYPSGGGIMPVIQGSQLRYYRGYVEAYRRSSTSMYAVNHLSMDRYLYGVVPREMPAGWHSVGLAAQAVAARSYSAWKKNDASSTASYDICATTQCQVYGGYGYRTSPGASMTVLENSRTNAAVDATSGYTMVSGGAPIFAEFHSSSGGYTAQGSRSYLAPVADPWDATYSPYYRWKARIPVSEIEAKWPALGRLAGIGTVERDGDGPWGGRVTGITLIGTDANVALSGSAFRSSFAWPTHSEGLRSSLFTIGVYDASLVSAPQEVLIQPGGTATIAIAFKNTGNRSWPVGDVVRVGTSAPKDRLSPFVSSTWVTSTRPTYVTKDLTDDGGTGISPGQTGEFRFQIAAPSTVSSGLYDEAFRPVAAGLTWFGDDVHVPVRVAFAGASHLGANLLQNASFEAASGSAPAGWSGSGITTSDGLRGGGLDGAEQVKLTGDPSLTKSYRQTVATSGVAGDRFVFSGWNRATGTSSTGTIGALVRIHNTDGTLTSSTVAFPATAHPWRFKEIASIAQKAFSSVDVTLSMSKQTGTTWFDRLRLARNDLRTGSFENPAWWKWITVNGGSGDGRDAVVARGGTASLRLHGRSTANVYAHQTVSLSGPAGDQIRLAGWNRNVGTTISGGGISVWAKVHNTDGTDQRVYVEFTRAPHAWGYGERIFTTLKPYSSIEVFDKITNQSGTAWFDDVSLARMHGSTSLSGNSGFELGNPEPADWTLINTTATSVATASAASGSASLHLAGDTARNVYARQYVPLVGEAGDVYRLSGKNKASGSSSTGGVVRVWARIDHADGTYETQILEFAKTAHDWTGKQIVFTTAKQYKRIDVFAQYQTQTGDAWYDSVRLEPVVS